MKQMEMVLISPDQLKVEISEAVKAALASFLPTHQDKNEDVVLLSRKATAKLLGISLPTLNSWTMSGQLTGYRIGSSIRYKKAEIEQSLKSIQAPSK